MTILLRLRRDLHLRFIEPSVTIILDHNTYKNKECLLNKMDIISIPKIDTKNKFKKNSDGTYTMLDTTENIIKHFVLVKKFSGKEK